jgi:hypothetical protein
MKEESSRSRFRSRASGMWRWCLFCADGHGCLDQMMVMVYVGLPYRTYMSKRVGYVPWEVLDDIVLD